MQKSGIQWCGFTSNPVKGECPVGCTYCYVNRFRIRYGWHNDIRFYPEELEAIRKRKKPADIFIGSTLELFHEKTIGYMPEIMDAIRACPQHRFYLLTKCPENLTKFSPFPLNCWVGITVTNEEMFDKAIHHLRMVNAKVKFISFEPLLGKIKIDFALRWASWVILGGQSGATKLYPEENWIQEIESAADGLGIPVFEKWNLRENWDKLPRQEMPE